MNNELYFTVLPVIHIGGQSHGLTEQILTLTPDKDFATSFFQDEVGGFIAIFKNRIPHLTGNHVKGYELYQEPQEDGRVMVRVIQNVG